MIVSDERFAEIVITSFSVREVIRKCDWSYSGSSYAFFYKRCKELHLDFSHFTGQGHLKGKQNPNVRRIPLSQILVEHSEFQNRSFLRKRLIKEGVFDAKCYKCGLTEWMDQPAPLELEHINGIGDDYRLENLTILCPNCHAQTDTYRGKNAYIY